MENEFMETEFAFVEIKIKRDFFAFFLAAIMITGPVSV